ncbi:MAG TPA: SDR family NAD(P)-dependent oxidoreductase [Chthoniobacterales bacterium]|jgi:NADP-dependent 3-hydroxy acid dehydrogenase YdfG
MALFAKRIFLVTGASGGVGEAIARRLGDNGATVWLSGRNLRRLDRLAEQLPTRRGRPIPGDLTVEDEFQKVVRQVMARPGHLDGIIHCAATISLASFATASKEDFEKQFGINVLVPFRLTQLLLPALTSSKGLVVFINSTAGRTALADVGQYAATKHALRALADSLRDECNAAGVRVCSIFLGSTATSMQAAVRAKQKRAYHPERLIQPDDVAQMVSGILALPQTAEVTDIIMRPTVKA